MLTNPNTLGIFDANIEEIAHVVHDVGATLYYDGANLNAVMGISRPGRHGLRHRALQPAQVLHPAPRRRRPGRGPDRGVRSHRALPAAARSSTRSTATAASTSTTHRPKSIGKLRGFQGNYGCFVRSYAYIRSLGAEGLKDASRDGRAQRQLPARAAAQLGVAEQLPLAFGELCMHEFVLSGAPMKRELQIRTLDLAKRLLDHGFHPPTVYFPLLVDEALLIEPTETETRETLDAFAEVVADILREAREDPDDRPRGALLDAGAPPRRGGRGQAPGHPPDALGVRRRTPPYPVRAPVQASAIEIWRVRA